MNKIMIIMCGLQCSGKSTIAKKLSTNLGLEFLSNDSIRTKLLDDPGILNSNPLDRYICYRHSIKLAEGILERGQSAVIDATFSHKVFRKGAYHLALKTGASIYLIECVCNNYGIILQRYEHRKELKNNNSHLFDEWTTPDPYNKLFREFERPDRETLPNGVPVPTIIYDSEHNKAEIIYSDGSEAIEMILEAITAPERVKV